MKIKTFVFSPILTPGITIYGRRMETIINYEGQYHRLLMGGDCVWYMYTELCIHPGKQVMYWITLP